MQQEITSKTLLVSAKGGTLDYVLPDGEVLFSVAVPPGKHPAGEYLDLCPDGAQVQIADGLVAIQPRHRIAMQLPDEMTESGANPDYQPTSADRLQRQMRLQLAQMQADQRRLDARLAKLSEIERIPQNPAPAPAAAAQADGKAGGEVVE